jgi:hypothetical protein
MLRPYSQNMRCYLIHDPRQGKAKVYQVKQVRNVILHYQLGGQGDDSV